MCSPVFGFAKSTNRFSNSLNKLCFNFIWNGGPDRIKRKFIVKDISKNGLRMLQIEHFITSLKITWLRRQILQQNCTWNILSNIDLDDVYTRGNNYASIKSEKVNNPFWKDLLNSWKIFCKSVKVHVHALEDILYSPLWYNSNFQHGQYIYFKDWYNKGIRNVIDLLDTDGNFYLFPQLQEIYNVRGTLLDHSSLLRKIPAQWKQKLMKTKYYVRPSNQMSAETVTLTILIKTQKAVEPSMTFL